MMDMILEIIEKLCNIRYVSNVEREEIAVGFDEEVETLLDQLNGTSAKQLQITSMKKWKHYLSSKFIFRMTIKEVELYLLAVTKM